MISLLRSRASQLALQTRRGLGAGAARQLHSVTRPLLFGVQNAADRAVRLGVGVGVGVEVSVRTTTTCIRRLTYFIDL